MLVQIEQEVRVPSRQPKRQYEILWKRESNLAKRVAMAWSAVGWTNDLADIMNGLDQVMTTLQSWRKQNFGNILRELHKAREILELLQLNNAEQIEIRMATDHMNELLYKEEILWLQRSRINWLKEQDVIHAFSIKKGLASTTK
jgi:hypothetical protein